jgi:hypothetical protein
MQALYGLWIFIFKKTGLSLFKWNQSPNTLKSKPKAYHQGFAGGKIIKLCFES